MGKVLLVEDDASLRDALTMLLEAAGYPPVAFESAERFLADWHPEEAACAIVDVRLPGMDGLALFHAMARRAPWVPVILITGHGDVPMAVGALKAGAFDFIEKPFDPDRLLATVQEALTAAQSGRIAAEELSNLSERLGRLTDRERETMQAMLQGQPNKVIAAQMGISARTVEIHRGRVMAKMEARSLSHLIRMGLTLERGRAC